MKSLHFNNNWDETMEGNESENFKLFGKSCCQIAASSWMKLKLPKRKFAKMRKGKKICTNNFNTSKNLI